MFYYILSTDIRHTHTLAGRVGIQFDKRLPPPQHSRCGRSQQEQVWCIMRPSSSQPETTYQIVKRFLFVTFCASKTRRAVISVRTSARDGQIVRLKSPQPFSVPRIAHRWFDGGITRLPDSKWRSTMWKGALLNCQIWVLTERRVDFVVFETEIFLPKCASLLCTRVSSVLNANISVSPRINRIASNSARLFPPLFARRLLQVYDLCLNSRKAKHRIHSYDEAQSIKKNEQNSRAW